MMRRMPRAILCFSACLILAAALAAPVDAAQTPPAALDAKDFSPQKQRDLIRVLKSDKPPADKAMACKQLAICGTKDAVPALAPLLADPQLASWARIALEAIPDPAADAALRKAMGKLSGPLLIGAINSIAVRRDAKAVAALAKKLKAADPEVASAAALALGRIGGTRAAKTLANTCRSGRPRWPDHPAKQRRKRPDTHADCGPPRYCRGLHPLRGRVRRPGKACRSGQAV